MSQTERALKELELAGFFDKTGIYDGMVGEAVMELFEVFANQGHSGMSAGIVSSLFCDLVEGKILTPLTGKDDEWIDVSEYGDGTTTHQNKRKSTVFKKADGKCYDIEGRIFRLPNGATYSSSESFTDVTFPYTPKTEIIDVSE